MFLLEGDFARLRTRLVNVLAVQPSGWASVGAYIDLYLDVLLDPAEDDRRRFYQAHIADEQSRLRVTHLREELIGPLEQALEQGRARGELHLEDVAGDARRTHNLLEGVVYAALHSGHPEDLAHVTASVRSFVRRALAANG